MTVSHEIDARMYLLFVEIIDWRPTVSMYPIDQMYNTSKRGNILCYIALCLRNLPVSGGIHAWSALYVSLVASEIIYSINITEIVEIDILFDAIDVFHSK